MTGEIAELLGSLEEPREAGRLASMTDSKVVLTSIVGRVQGVWFRAWTVERARLLGIQGWVRNRLDGSVEALFAGPSEAVDQLVRDCWQGPSAARVTDVHTAPAEEDPSSPGFFQRPTV